MRNLRKRALFWTLYKPLPQSFQKEMEAKFTKSQGSRQERDQTDLGLYEMPSFWKSY